MPRETRSQVHRRGSTSKRDDDDDDEEPRRMMTRLSARKLKKPLEKEEESSEESQEEEEEKKAEPKKKQFEWDFGGPIRALAVTVVLPLVVCVLAVACDDKSCFGTGDFDLEYVKVQMKSLFEPKAFGVCVAWWLFQAFLYVALPGNVVKGVALKKTGKRLDYKMNGHLAFWVTLLIMGHAYPKETGGFGAFPLAYLYDHFPQLAFAASCLSFLSAVACYALSFRIKEDHLLAEPGNSGNHIYDFFMGRELNPRLFGFFDLKFFNELRPGLVGWLMIDIGCLLKQSETGPVSLSMILVCLFQGLYVWDALYHEKSILTTMDVTTDGFGMMLAFGDLAWVPFTYSLQARFLVAHQSNFPVYITAALVPLNFIGYAIFRGANSQKDAFRNDPSSSNYKVLHTKRGTKLLLSGFWGMARKINYTGILVF